MSSLDIVQLRWQSLRAFEASQVYEAENFELKSQVLSLKAQLKETHADNKRALSSLGRSVKHWISGIRGDLKSLQRQSADDLHEAGVANATLASALQRLEVQGASDDSTIQQLKNERMALQTRLDESQRETAAANRSLVLEADRNRAQIEKLRAELGESDSQRALLLQQCEEQASQHLMQQQRYDALHRQCDGLLHTIKRLEVDHVSTLSDFREAEARLLYDHSTQLTARELEADKLLLTIAQLEQQIERLTAALMGNKSHFHKFIELKAENVSLHSELKTIASKNIANTLLLVPPEGPHSHGRSGGRRRSNSPGRSVDGGGSVTSFQTFETSSQAKTVTGGNSSLRRGRDDKESRGDRAEILLGSKLKLRPTRPPNGRHHSPVRSGDDESVVSQISAGSYCGNNAGTNIRLSLPAASRDFLQSSEETPRETSLKGGLARVTAKGIGSRPSTHEENERIGGTSVELPLSVPLLSKVTRDGLVHRHTANV